MDYVKATGILLITVVALLSVIFQITHVMDIMANITDIWIWIAAALIGVGFNLITRKRTQQPKTETTKKISLTKEIPEFYSSRKELPTLEDFLGSARDEIDLMGFSLWDIVVQNRATIITLLKQGKHIRFILLNPTSVDVKKFEEAIVDANLKDQIQHSLEQLRALKNGLSDVERGRLDIRTHDLLPFHTIIAVDAKSDSGVLQVESYVYGTDSRLWSSLRISKKNQPQLFEKYWKSYEYVHEHSRDIDAITEEIERSKEEQRPQSRRTRYWEGLSFSVSPDLLKRERWTLSEVVSMLESAKATEYESLEELLNLRRSATSVLEIEHLITQIDDIINPIINPRKIDHCYFKKNSDQITDGLIRLGDAFGHFIGSMAEASPVVWSATDLGNSLRKIYEEMVGYSNEITTELSKVGKAVSLENIRVSWNNLNLLLTSKVTEQMRDILQEDVRELVEMSELRKKRDQKDSVENARG